MTGDPADDCPLAPGAQLRNIGCFAAFWCLYYLGAPVLYVGTAHANLLKGLKNNDAISNLPSACYLWFTVIPVLVAWFFPQPRQIKPLALCAVAAMAAVSALVAFALWQGSATLATYSVIAHGAVFGAANGVLITSLWDIVRRGVSTSRRGRALGLTFGIGPLFACLGSLGQDAVLGGGLLKGFSNGLPFPQNYLAMFAAVVPLLLFAAVLVTLFEIPPSFQQPEESKLAEILGGVKDFIANRAVLCAVIAYVLVYCGGNAIMANVSLHAKEVLGQMPVASTAQTTTTAQAPVKATPTSSGPMTLEKPAALDTLGMQSFLRFGFKAFTGVFLGWLLTKTSPRATLLATTTILLFAMVWALTSQGWWFLLTFGFLGSGELFGAYFPNYVATASPKRSVRANMAYLSLLSSLIGFAALGFGLISDNYGRIASFYAATAVLLVAMAFILAMLPADPTPREGELETLAGGR